MSSPDSKSNNNIFSNSDYFKFVPTAIEMLSNFMPPGWIVSLGLSYLTAMFMTYQQHSTGVTMLVLTAMTLLTLEIVKAEKQKSSESVSDKHNVNKNSSSHQSGCVTENTESTTATSTNTTSSNANANNSGSADTNANGSTNSKPVINSVSTEGSADTTEPDENITPKKKSIHNNNLKILTGNSTNRISNSENKNNKSTELEPINNSDIMITNDKTTTVNHNVNVTVNHVNSSSDIQSQTGTATTLNLVQNTTTTNLNSNTKTSSTTTGTAQSSSYLKKINPSNIKEFFPMTHLYAHNDYYGGISVNPLTGAPRIGANDSTSVITDSKPSNNPSVTQPTGPSAWPGYSYHSNNTNVNLPGAPPGIDIKYDTCTGSAAAVTAETQAQNPDASAKFYSYSSTQKTPSPYGLSHKLNNPTIPLSTYDNASTNTNTSASKHLDHSNSRNTYTGSTIASLEARLSGAVATMDSSDNVNNTNSVGNYQCNTNSTNYTNRTSSDKHTYGSGTRRTGTDIHGNYSNPSLYSNTPGSEEKKNQQCQRKLDYEAIGNNGNGNRSVGPNVATHWWRSDNNNRNFNGKGGVTGHSPNINTSSYNNTNEISSTDQYITKSLSASSSAYSNLNHNTNNHLTHTHSNHSNFQSYVPPLPSAPPAKRKKIECQNLNGMNGCGNGNLSGVNGIGNANGSGQKFGDSNNNILITTLMVRHLPCKLTFDELEQTLKDHGFDKTTYDFLYLPQDLINNTNRGYAFINMSQTEHVTEFRRKFCRYQFHKKSSKMAHVVNAHLQGFASLYDHFHRTVVKKHKNCIWMNPTSVEAIETNTNTNGNTISTLNQNNHKGPQGNSISPAAAAAETVGASGSATRGPVVWN